MSSNRLITLTVFAIILLCSSCITNNQYSENFDNIHDRTWINNDFITIPLEDWRVQDGRVECVGSKTNMKAVLLKNLLQDEGSFLINLRMGLISTDGKTGSGGLMLGMQDETDMGIKSLAFFGTGLNIGVDTDKNLFIGEISKPLPEDFDLSDFSLYVDGEKTADGAEVRVQATDENGVKTDVLVKSDLVSFEGAISLVNNHRSGKKYVGKTNYWFDEISVSGSAVFHQEENEFGPILWAMYTLSKNTLKLSAQLPPIGLKDNQYVELHLMKDGVWEINQSIKIDPASRTALFKLENWDDSEAIAYQLRYIEKDKNGEQKQYEYDGLIRKDPKDKELVMGGLTCQYHYGFPYRPLTDNLAKTNPDILYFSGDQIYEGNGGYSIVRFPADKAILSYLGKWYMFGWAFGDVMRDRPTVTIPDDHDVFHGNLWGDGGANIEESQFRKTHGSSGGYVEPAEMVQVVHTTQCSHLPDPFDPSPMQQGLSAYYTELLYGNVSFAIVGDRMFKSGPSEIAFWEGRKDHLKTKINNISRIDKPGLKLLGERQMNFLKNWAQDWTGAKMKCLLSQTIFTNVATHHGGGKEVIFADLDSGAWPMTPRNKAVNVIRTCFSFHIAGDQHLPTLTQYGIKEFRDAGWAFCTPAITVGYQRRFFPELLGMKITERPEHNLPNTGKYWDPFGHPSYVYAVGNPEDDTRDPNRYERAQKCSSGFGLIRFDTKDRTIESNAYHFFADLNDKENPDNQFPGWPLTIDQLDNYGRKTVGELKNIELNIEEEYLQLYSEKTGELVYALRPKSSPFKPFVFERGTYTVRVVNENSGEIVQSKGLTIQ